MSLVVNDGYGTRVGPKVFSDVPSAAEVQSAKRGRATLLLVTLFLAGLLVAAGFVIAYFLSQNYPEQTEPGGAREQIEELKRDKEVAEKRAADLDRVVARYRPVADAETGATVVIGRINELLREKPHGRQALAIYRDRWTAYEDLYNRRWVAPRVTEINAQVATVTPLVALLEALPATPSGGGGTTGPTPGGPIIPDCDPVRFLCD